MGATTENSSGEYQVRMPKPLLLEGGIILGRETGVPVGPDDFSTSYVLMNLSARDVHGGYRGVRTTERQETPIESVVEAVLKVTHAELFQNGDILAVHHIHRLLGFYATDAPDLNNDKGIIEATEDTFGVIANTDLMRGMSAFSEAEYDRNQGMYDLTIIRPATRLAAWMIAIERDPQFIDE